MQERETFRESIFDAMRRAGAVEIDLTELEAPICPHCTRYPRKKIEDHTGDYYATYCVACQRTIIRYIAAQNRIRFGKAMRYERV